MNEERTKAWKMMTSHIPFVLEYKWRAAIAVAMLLAAKGATVAVPLVLKQIVDTLDKANGPILAAPIGLVLASGA